MAVLKQNHTNVKDTALEREEVLTILSELYQNPRLTQREISSRINISLGKTNYLLNSLIDKGIVKIKSFSSHNGKLKKVHYILTAKGMQEKIRITYHFLKKKEEEYALIKKAWQRLSVTKRGVPLSVNSERS